MMLAAVRPAAGRLVVTGAQRACPASPASCRRGPSTPSRTSRSTGWKAKKLASALLEETGVATIGGPDFGVHGEGYIRLSYANSLENIERALERMGTFLKSAKAA